ncbi:MAG TPA: MdtA/MuxA family multidrug efflux RND transporter periplasmic adaptor subunit [Alphaproteobacteria bacterium]|nr:MdtA/MuxA family multidrug efflux RND transporter periplasmic adaptor subunit [Alphaproteobacteria bacterium]
MSLSEPDSESPVPPKKRRGRWLVLIGLLLIAAIAWYGLHGAAPAKHGHAGGETVPVGAALAQKTDIGITFQALGTVTPLHDVTVRSRIDGQLMKIGFTEGQMVKPGDFLAEIDPRPYQLALMQAEGALQRDAALLKNARLDLARYKKLLAENAVARQQYDTQISLVAQDQGNVKADRAQIDTENLNLTYCHITAPVAGRVGLRQVDTGNYVQTTDAGGIVAITQLQPISVIFTLPEDDLPTIMKRLAQGATLPVTAFNRTGNQKLEQGTLSAVDNQVDPSTGTVKMRAQFANTDDVLFPDQFVNITLLADTLKGAIAAPSAAIQRGTPGTFVYLIQPNHTVKVQPVTLGPSQNDKVAITKGLVAGDMVVVDGADKLRDGARISLPGEARGEEKN